MKILTKPSEVRAAIQDLFRDPHDQRIVVVGFVGLDAASFLPHAANIELYCWPKAGGTNPHGVRALLDAGVDVRFVDRLHAKVYWSLSRGALVGSANLSSNALGEGGLSEYMIRLPPNAIDARHFVRTLKPLDDFDAVLKQLDRDHKRYQARNPVRQGASAQPVPLRRFNDWWEARASESEWRIAWWEDDEPAPRDAVNALEEETGDRRFARFVGVHRRGDLHEGVATLDVKVQRLPSKRLRLGAFNWWFARHCSRTHAPSWKEYPHIWFGTSTLPETGPPFNARDPLFRLALTQVFNDVGMDALPVKPSLGFLKALARYYDAASRGPQTSGAR